VAKLQSGSIVKQYYYDAAGQMIEAADAGGAYIARLAMCAVKV